MNALVWNARGLGSRRAFHELRRLLSDRAPNLVFISETKLCISRCERWKSIFGFDGLFVVDAIGNSGGLLLMWKNPIDITLRSYSQGHIDCIVKWSDKQWRFTGFYGNPDSNLRKFSWNLLRKLAKDDCMQNLAWLVGGDFNEILFGREKVGGRCRSILQMNGFREVLHDCDLYDADPDDTIMTWTNRRAGTEAVWEKLDRALLNGIWKLTFPSVKIQALDFYGSDHRPLCISMEFEPPKQFVRGNKRFHFEEKWFLEPTFVPDFLFEWDRIAAGVSNLPNKLQRCQEFFQKWAGKRFDALGKKVNKLRTERTKLLNDSPWKNNEHRLQFLNEEIERSLDMEESHWKARARTNWLAQGDRNTPSFHAYASARKKKNSIKGLDRGDGVWVTENKDMADVVSRYFDNLFATSRPSRREIDDVVGYIDVGIGESNCNYLNMEFTAEEVKQALFDIHPSKSPGPDGLSARFFQKFWPAIGEVLTNAALGILNHGDNMQEWNKTLIVLIPKVDKPTTVKEFRPISLCNTTYKIISKVIVNRLRRVLSEVIDENQSAFLSGRQITDNIIVGFECMHWIQNKGRKSSYA